LKTELNSEAAWSCRDAESGIFHRAHFLAALEGELARQDRWARPLALALVELAPAPDWAAFGPLARAALRPIDLAARLSDNRAGFIFPEADQAWAWGRLAELLSGLRRHDRLGGLAARTGLALAQPRSGLSAGEMMALAAQSLASIGLVASGPDWAARTFAADPVSAIVEDERLLLFEGFRALEDGRRP
jgi:hypothetical protein